MKRSLSIRTILALGPLFAAGCATAPSSTLPEVATPATWKEETPDRLALAERWMPPTWWAVFDDPDLNLLETQVIVANQDLQQAAARVAEARALARLSAADRSPTFSVNSSAGRTSNSLNEPNAPGLARETSDYRQHFDLSYEIDFWGRNRHAADAGRWDAYAAENDFHSLFLTLTTDAARHYHEVRALDAEIRVIESTLDLRQDTVRLQISRHSAGLINEADVSRARTELANTEAELHAVNRSRARLEHALALLSGQAAGDFTIPARSYLDVPPVIPSGLPSDLLQRRPDINAATQRFAAALSRAAVAKADFFPRLTLTGSAGFASTDLGNLTSGRSGTWSFGPSVYLPLFDGGRNRANLGAAEARCEQLASAYHSTVLNAFREVEDALSDLRTLARQAEATQAALVAARDTAKLASARYAQGLSNYLDVVDAQRGVFQAERADVQLRGQQITSTLLLAKALGGGWRTADSFDGQ